MYMNSRLFFLNHNLIIYYKYLNLLAISYGLGYFCFVYFFSFLNVFIVPSAIKWLGLEDEKNSISLHIHNVIYFH